MTKANNQPNSARPFLTAEWRSLAMLNYEVDADVLRPHVPSGTELDTHNRILYVSVVGFLFLHTRILGVPIPLHQNFEEVNLRFYVKHRAHDEWRRGVVFINEIVPRRAIAAVARWVYNENYVARPMRHAVQLPTLQSPQGSVDIGWRTRPRWNTIRIEFEGEPLLPEPGYEAEFITEHYWGYTRQRSGSTIEYRVDRSPWPVWRANRAEFDCDIGDVFGEAFVEPLSVNPVSAFVAVGSEVSVGRGTPIANR